MPRIDDIEVFIGVYEQRSLTQAARKTGLPVATISRKLLELEKRLGTVLINRTTRNVSPTEAGTAFYEKVSQAVDVIRDAESEIRGLTRAPAGTVRLVLPYALGITVVQPLLAEFAAIHPSVDFAVLFDNERHDPVEFGADMTLHIGAVPDSALLLRRLGTIGMMLVASPDYIARHGAPQDPEALLDHRLLAASLRPGPEIWSFDGPRTADVRIAPRICANDPLLGLRAAVAGFGIARVNTLVARTDVERGALVAVLPDWRLKTLYDLSLLYPKRATLDLKIRLFMDFLTERLAPLL